MALRPQTSAALLNPASSTFEAHDASEIHQPRLCRRRERDQRRVIHNGMIKVRFDHHRYAVTIVPRRTCLAARVVRHMQVHPSVMNTAMTVRDSKKAQNVEAEDDSSEQQPIRDGFPAHHGKHENY